MRRPTVFGKACSSINSKRFTGWPDGVKFRDSSVRTLEMVTRIQKRGFQLMHSQKFNIDGTVVSPSTPSVYPTAPDTSYLKV